MTYRQFLSESVAPKMVFHAFSMSALASSIALTLFAFYRIAFYGYFFAYEPNTAILTVELGVSIYSAFYLFFMLQKIFRETWKARK